jgi:glycine/D-amino acid oxidase-like deaminating enzyme
MTRRPLLPQHLDSNGWWALLPEAPPPSVLSGRHRVRTAIVGAGICGLAVARRLGELRRSEPIALVEAERAGFGASGRNAGFMLNLHSHGQPKDLSILRRNMKLWTAGLEELRRLVREHQIRCDWSDWGRLYVSAGPDGERHFDELAETLDRLEQPHDFVDPQALEARIGSRFYRRGLHAQGNALVNPAALMRGLAKSLPANVALYEQSPVLAIEPSAGRFVLSGAEGRLEADEVVLANGIFLSEFGVCRDRYLPMATYASLTRRLTTEELGALGSEREFGLFATSENGSTVRLTRDRRLFMRNTFTHEPGKNPSARTLAAARDSHRLALARRWPALAELEFEHSWGGGMAFTVNDGAIFGELKTGLYAILTNDISPVTRGAIAGKLLAELMVGEDSELLSLQLAFPRARRLPPRPVIDLAVDWKLRAIRRAGKADL